LLEVAPSSYLQKLTLAFCVTHNLNLILILILIHQPHTSTTSLDTKIHSAFLRMRADCLPHASVIVSVNDKILTEHSTENDALSVTTFVEAVAGAHFAVVLQLHDAFAYRHPSDRIHFAVHLDGEYAAAYIVNPSTQSPLKSTINSTVETIHNQTTRRNFIFASHETSTLRPPC
jgi:hypothetical protein